MKNGAWKWLLIGMVFAETIWSLDMIPPMKDAVMTSGQGLRKNPMGGSLEQFHNAEDWVAPKGAEVYAVAKGKVIEVYAPNPGHPIYGGMVRLLHEDKSTTLYAHLSQVNVWLGWFCWQGRVIGIQGNTGISTGDHLHFERSVPIVFIEIEKEDPVDAFVKRALLYFQAAEFEQRNMVP